MPSAVPVPPTACAPRWTSPSPPQTTRASTPSATARSASTLASSASRPTRSWTANPAARRRGSAMAAYRAPLPLPEVGLVRKAIRRATPGPYPPRSVVAAHDTETERHDVVVGSGAHRLGQPADGVDDPVRGEAGAGHRQGRAAVVGDQQDLPVPPRLVGGPAGLLPPRRGRVGLVHRQQVAGLLVRAVLGAQPAAHVEAGPIGVPGLPGDAAGAQPVREVEGVQLVEIGHGPSQAR